jgi:hypothetical protein
MVRVAPTLDEVLLCLAQHGRPRGGVRALHRILVSPVETVEEELTHFRRQQVKGGNMRPGFKQEARFARILPASLPNQLLSWWGISLPLKPAAEGVPALHEQLEDQDREPERIVQRLPKLVR